MTKRMIAIALSASMMLSACATTMPHSGPTNTKVHEFPKYTNDYIIAIYYGFDADGHINTNRLDASGKPIPKGMLTHMESTMIDSADRFCTDEVNLVSGRFGYDLKNTVRFSVAEGVLGAVGGHAGFPTMGFKPLLEEIGGSAAGGGLAGSEMTWEESLRVVHSYCVMMIVAKNSSESGDGRLKQIIILPLIAGKAIRPDTMSDDGYRFVRTNRTDKDDPNRLTAETTAPPLVPLP